MTSVTRHCCRPQGTVWVDKHFDQKSQVMATLEMASFGPVAGAWEAARFNMAAARLAQLGERRSAEREAVGSNPGRTSTQGL